MEIHLPEYDMIYHDLAEPKHPPPLHSHPIVEVQLLRVGELAVRRKQLPIGAAAYSSNAESAPQRSRAAHLPCGSPPPPSLRKLSPAAVWSSSMFLRMRSARYGKWCSHWSSPLEGGKLVSHLPTADGPNGGTSS